MTNVPVTPKYLLFIAAIVLLLNPIAIGQSSDPQKFIEDFSRQLLRIVNERGAVKRRMRRFKETLFSNVEEGLPETLLDTNQPLYKRLKEEDKERYKARLKDYIAAEAFNAVSDASVVGFYFDKTVPIEKYNEIEVHGRLGYEDQARENKSIVWYLSKETAGLKLFDIEVDEIPVLTRPTGVIEETMKNNTDNLPKLLTELETRARKLEDLIKKREDQL